MRIGELAKRTGLSRDTIRFYERHGLIASLPSRDPANSYRDYPDYLVDRLDMIMAAREAGLSVADLAQLMSAMEGGNDAFDAHAFIDGKIAQVEETLRSARAFLKVLKQTRTALDALPVEWRNDAASVEKRDRASGPDDAYPKDNR